MRIPSLLAKMTKPIAQTKKRIQMPNQKYCQNPPCSTTVVRTAEANESIPITAAPAIFVIVVTSGSRGRGRPVAGVGDKSFFMSDTGRQVPGHTPHDDITLYVSDR